MLEYTKKYMQILKEAIDPLAEYGALREYIQMLADGEIGTPEEAVDAAIKDGFLDYEHRDEAIKDFHWKAKMISDVYLHRHDPFNIANMKFGLTRD